MVPMGFIYGGTPHAPRRNAPRPGHCIPRTNAAGNPYPYGSAATLETVTTQGLQREQQTVRVVMQTLGILNGGVQEFAGVHRKAHRVVGVALGGSTELTQAFAFVGTVADIRSGKRIVLFGGPLGSSSTAGFIAALTCCSRDSRTLRPFLNCRRSSRSRLARPNPST